LRRKSGIAFIHEQLGEDGIDAYIRLAAERAKKSNASPALIVLKLMSAISPGYAFTLTAKQISYQIQWVGNIELSELNAQRAFLNSPHCLVTDYPDTEDIFCQIGCRRSGTLWVAEQFKIDTNFHRQGQFRRLIENQLAHSPFLLLAYVFKGLSICIWEYTHERANIPIFEHW
jgi:hypothetical protein